MTEGGNKPRHPHIYKMDDEWNDDYMVYDAVCPKCGGLVKPDAETDCNYMDGASVSGTNAWCPTCGRVQMPWVDLMDTQELQKHGYAISTA